MRVEIVTPGVVCSIRLRDLHGKFACYLFGINCVHPFLLPYFSYNHPAGLLDMSNLFPSSRRTEEDAATRSNCLYCSRSMTHKALLFEAR